MADTSSGTPTTPAPGGSGSSSDASGPVPVAPSAYQGWAAFQTAVNVTLVNALTDAENIRVRTLGLIGG